MQFKSLAYVLLGQSALVAAQSATTTAPSAVATCEPHEDHWHCPSGVVQPSLNPDGSVNTKATPSASQGASASQSSSSHDDHDHDHDHDTTATGTASGSASASATTTVATGPNGCTPHGDHWHCPSGVAKPTTPPPGYTPPASSSGATTSRASASATPSATPVAGAAGRVGPLGLSVVVGGGLLLGALFL
ncbi:hypothetical protein CCM_05022 [Cordyceps militaris CM01]|uniref:Uncharacterized protein n=1 Tax=Cordyceps militaris (strain CM01) TaxID=983644 RepID=G3JG29_CORMM|nr:uncharacterized protein CCM_05022 [Cordyceps militaris CM01]EGX93647.1 hypothetical protein CCM_05022 [Cordyceps militaris CM01]